MMDMVKEQWTNKTVTQVIFSVLVVSLEIYICMYLSQFYFYHLLSEGYIEKENIAYLLF